MAGFSPSLVIVIISLTYIALFASLITVHHTVPSAPSSPAPVKGINLTEAWLDLKRLTSTYHPYNSRVNDGVRDWLLLRVKEIFHRNNVSYKIQPVSTRFGPSPYSNDSRSPSVFLYDDIQSNVTFSSTVANQSVYFEGTNIIVYIKGTRDEEAVVKDPVAYFQHPGPWEASGGVLVNAHYDSVSTGHGATDDGVGVITVLQLISYFTTPENAPKKGVLALLNNGEEDYLNGARAFTHHPMSQFPHTFLNLEGAGAGGRATLFRSSDTEITKFYKNSPHPFGSVISGDGFKRGLVRSQTDYVIFEGVLGLRGLDVAFMEPRSKYHTSQDDVRDTSIDSLWHMLSASLETMKGLTSDTSNQFVGEPRKEGMANSGKGSDGVWFDIYGRTFAVFRLHSLFAISVTLLVVTPLLLFFLMVLLIRLDKWYLWSRRKYLHSPDDDEAIPLNGWRGFFRFPTAFVISSAAVVGLALLVTKINPYIVYSSPYSVWSMTLSAWFSICWFLLRGSDAMRPSALSRAYALIWMYAGAYTVLVAVTVFEKNLHIAGGYFMVFYFAAVFFALLLSYLEMFKLPRKTAFVQYIVGSEGSHTPTTRRSGSMISSRPLTAANDINSSRGGPNDDDDATETTSLLRGDRSTTFARYGTRRRSVGDDSAATQDSLRDLPKPYGSEQPWSGRLPSWIWILQFLLFAFVIILVGQVALLLTSALHQTLADGNSALIVYLMVAMLTVLLIAPVGPFIHRFTLHIPTFLFLVLIGTLIYNLVAFPFSPNSRLKVYFLQQVDLTNELNTVSLTGLESYVRKIIAEIPSASGQMIHCVPPDLASRSGLSKCSWRGKYPQITLHDTPTPTPGTRPDRTHWLKFNVTRPDQNNSATFTLSGRHTRSCRIYFDTPITDLHVEGSAEDKRFEPVGKHGTREVRLWSREWERSWTVHVKWSGEEGLGMDGRIACLWSDANDPELIPALEEVKKFMPTWSIVSKAGDGLVEGSKPFMILPLQRP